VGILGRREGFTLKGVIGEVKGDEAIITTGVYNKKIFCHDIFKRWYHTWCYSLSFLCVHGEKLQKGGSLPPPCSGRRKIYSKKVR